MSSSSATHLVLACLLSALPGPPGVRYEDAYVQLLPVDKTKCPTIDPVRDIAFQLFTRNNPLMADVLRIGDDTALANSHMNFSDPTVLFFHAFFESSTGTTSWTIKTAYLQRKQHNLILLNAPRLEAGPWYFTAARNTRVVGEYSAQFIDYLVSKGMPLHSLHLLGLSLGAQMAGVAGSNVKSGRVPRITGMDPAGPLFTKLPNSLKLDKSDAEFVNIIHTDAGIFGYPRAIGHADFWPNQGISPQPGCRFPEVKRRNPDTILELFFCSHWRSYQFYAESVVNDNGFLAVPCNSWEEFTAGSCANQQAVKMGYSAPSDARGNYYLATNPESPYSMEGNPKTLAESSSEGQQSSLNSQLQFSIQEDVRSFENENQGGYYYPVPNVPVQQNTVLYSQPTGQQNSQEQVYGDQKQNYPVQQYDNVYQQSVSKPPVPNVQVEQNTVNSQPQVQQNSQEQVYGNQQQNYPVQQHDNVYQQSVSKPSVPNVQIQQNIVNSQPQVQQNSQEQVYVDNVYGDQQQNYPVQQYDNVYQQSVPKPSVVPNYIYY